MGNYELVDRTFVHPELSNADRRAFIAFIKGKSTEYRPVCAMNFRTRSRRTARASAKTTVREPRPIVEIVGGEVSC